MATWPALRGRATAVGSRARAVCFPRTRLLEACARASAGVGGRRRGRRSHSSLRALTLCVPRHGLPARTSSGKQPGRAGAGSAACVPALPCDRAIARFALRPRWQQNCGGNRATGSLVGAAREVGAQQQERARLPPMRLRRRARAGWRIQSQQREEKPAARGRPGQVLWLLNRWEQSYRLTSGRGMGAGSTAAGGGDAAADAAPPACEGEWEEEELEVDPASEACRERGGQSQAKWPA